MATNPQALPRPGDPDYELVSSAAAKLLMDNRKLAEDPAKLLQETLKLAEQAKKAGLSEVDTWQRGPTGEKVPGQYVDRHPGAFGANGESGSPNEQRPIRQPELSLDDAYKILKTAYDQTQAAESKKNAQEQSRSDIAAKAEEVFKPGKAEVKPAGSEATSEPTAPGEKDKKQGSLLSVDGKKQTFEAFGGAVAGGWKNNDDQTITAKIYHPIEGSTVSKAGASATVGQSGLQSVQADVQFKPYRAPAEKLDTTVDIAAGYDIRAGKGAFGQVTYDEGSVGNRFNVKVADGDKGATVGAAGVIGTGRTFEVKDDAGKLAGIRREGQIQVSGEFGPGKSSASVGYKSNDEVPANAKTGTPALAASTSAVFSVSDDPTKTQYGFKTQMPVNGASGNFSATFTDSKVGGDTTALAAGYGSRDGFNGVRVGYQNAPNGDTFTVGGTAGSAKLNGSVTATIASETTVNAKVNGEIAPNLKASADVTYNATQGNVYGKGSLDYVNPNGQFAAGLSVGQDKNGQFAGAFTIRAGADPNASRSNIDPGAAVDRGVAEFKVSQLTGDDKRRYDQAVAGVERLNQALEKENKPKMPVMETALSLATLADSQKPQLDNIRDVQLGRAKDGKEMLIISDKSLEQDPHARRFAIDRQLAASISPLDNLERMQSNNLVQTMTSGRVELTQSANDQGRTSLQTGEKMDNQVIERETVAASMRR